MIKAVLFDLDGTLLPMDQELFTKTYFKALAEKLAPYGYEPDELIKGVWRGTLAMIGNDGAQSNEEIFWKTFSLSVGDKVYKDKQHFEEFYRTDFENLKSVCGIAPAARKLVQKLKTFGLKIVLATNPVFPLTAVESRIRWSGLLPTDFGFCTSYETSKHCKPNPLYYADIAERLGCRAEDCLMVGNDVDEDMVAAKIGMKVFLLTDCLLNKSKKDISVYPRGGFDELEIFLRGETAERE